MKFQNIRDTKFQKGKKTLEPGIRMSSEFSKDQKLENNGETPSEF